MMSAFGKNSMKSGRPDAVSTSAGELHVAPPSVDTVRQVCWFVSERIRHTRLPDASSRACGSAYSRTAMFLATVTWVEKVRPASVDFQSTEYRTPPDVSLMLPKMRTEPSGISTGCDVPATSLPAAVAGIVY